MTSSVRPTREQDGLRIRRGTLADLAGMLALHHTIFTPETNLLTVFGESVVRSGYKWFVDSPLTFSIVAEIDGRVVGYCTACARPYSRRMFVRTMPLILWALLRSPRILFFELKILKRVKELLRLRRNHNGRRPASSESVAQLGMVAVDADYRGRGVATDLLLSVVGECRKRNCRRLRAGVYKRNLPARSRYERLGFVESKDQETESRIFMELDLT